MPSAATNVDERARALYGAMPPRPRGVLHIVAVAREAEGLRVMRIGPAPKSAEDYFALELARAQVDAVLLSGSILRAEPELRYSLSPELAAFRGSDGPTPVILTRGDVPVAHPIFERPAVVFTGESAAYPLREELPNHISVVGVPSPSASAALAFLEETGARAISVEAGPRVSVPLHEAARIDELRLSVFEGPLAADARGGAFLSEAALGERLERVSEPIRVEEPSGPWTFSRWRRRR